MQARSEQPWRLGRLSPKRAAVAVVSALLALLAAWPLIATGTRPPDAGAPSMQVASVAPTRTPARSTTVPVRDEPTAVDSLDRTQALQSLRAGRVASRALARIRQRYVDPDKVVPRAMIDEALQAVAHMVPEMLVDAPVQDADGRPLELRVRIADATLRIPLAVDGDGYRLNWWLLEALRFVADHLPPDVSPSEVEYVAINGMLSTLDPYSRMLDPEAWRDMQTNTGGNFGGLGIVILAVDGVLTVQSVIPGSPAERAGLMQGDQIEQIDGEDTVNMTVDDAVDRLRGEVGTAARLVVRREGWERAQEIIVVRAVIHLRSVESKVLDNGMGYAKIKNFQRGTAGELAAALEDLLRNGAQNGLVLDLRDNPGGLLDEAIRVCDLFIAAGPAVITVTGGDRQRDVRMVSGQGRYAQMALAVLVNGHSASASEVVAGALKYSNRAIVLGEQSFGKASVQVPYPIEDGALKLTIAKYLVPGDINIHGVGITPDVGLQFVSATREQIDLFGGPRYSRAIKKTRVRMEAVPPPIPPNRLRILLPEPMAGARADHTVVETPAEAMDREPRERAAALLRRAGNPRASIMLATARLDLAEMAHADDLELVAHLKRQGIDWQPGPVVLDAKLRVQIAAEPQGLEVAAGSVLRMSATLTNQGRSPLYRLHVLTACDDPALDGHEQLVGRLDPGASKTINLRVRISVRHPSLQVPMRVVAAQDGTILPAADETLMTVTGRETPELAYRFSLDDAAAGPGPWVDGTLQPGESAQVRVEVENRGVGPSQATVVSLRSLSGQRMHLEDGRVALGPLAPGAKAVAQFAVRGADAPPAAGSPAVADFEPVRAELVLADDSLALERKAEIAIPWGRRGLSAAPAADRQRVAALRQTGAEVWDAPPRITLALDERQSGRPGFVAAMSGSCLLDLAGVALFDAQASARRFVTASVQGVKQTYHAGQGQAQVPFQARLRLDSGLNTVTIQAQAGPHRTAARELWVHCRPGP
ncbi:MAG: S41 family peptidase [Myxococcota bacterium]